AGRWDLSLLARWLRAEAARTTGDDGVAAELLNSTLAEAGSRSLPQLAARCHASLGMLFARSGDAGRAEASLKSSIALIEDLRAMLPSDELRTAFAADKQAPYSELVGLCLADPDGNRTAEAFGYVERARSRALVDMLGGAVEFRHTPRDQFESDLLARLEQLGEELNWFYSQMARQFEPTVVSTAPATKSLRNAARDREVPLAEISRQLQQREATPAMRVEPVGLVELQRRLGPDTALVEYFGIHGELFAFVITDESIELLTGLGGEDQARRRLERLRFQVNSLRFGQDR